MKLFGGLPSTAASSAVATTKRMCSSVQFFATTTSMVMTMTAVMMTSTTMTSAGPDDDYPLCHTRRGPLPPPPPLHSRPLNESLLDSGDMLVVWGTGEEMTCHSLRTCFPTSKEHDISLPTQLLPVEIPDGVSLSFVMSTDTDSWGFPFFFYEVDAEGFRLCDASYGVKVSETLSSNESVTLNTTALTPGIHYFIVEQFNDSVSQCSLGLRINVTVKPVNCPVSNGHVCCPGGLCLTNLGQTNYSCFCCGSDKEANDCDQPCQHGGVCQRNATSAAGGGLCQCRLGFHGTFCESRVQNLCETVTCQNNGTCRGNDTHFRCACAPGFSGSHCEVNVNECASNPCVHGLCLDGDNDYTCYCEPGFHGRRCEMDYDECASAPCLHEGFCQNMQDNFTCHCHPGYTGRTCSTKIHTCIERRPCRHGSRCQELTFGYRCICSPGFTGGHCEVNIDECAGQPCLNGGTCVDRVAGYRCLCLEMHAGPNCQYPLDMFGPMIDIRGLHQGGEEERAYHVRNMYVVSGTLSVAVLVVLAVLVTCYCRVRASRPVNSILRRHHNYSRHHDDLSQPVDITSVSNPRLSVDAIWEATSLNYDVTQLGSPIRGSSLKSLEV